MPYIALARKAGIYRAISDSLGTLLWIRNELWSVLQHITLCSILQCAHIIFDLSLLLSIAQTKTLSCIQLNLGSDNITIMSKARDNLDIPQGDAVYTKPSEKIWRFEIYWQYIGAGCTRSALAQQQSFEKVSSSSTYSQGRHWQLHTKVIA